MSHDCPYRAAMKRVLSIELETHANTSRDFGRGFAFALSLVCEAASTPVVDAARLQLDDQAGAC